MYPEYVRSWSLVGAFGVPGGGDLNFGKGGGGGNPPLPYEAQQFTE